MNKTKAKQIHLPVDFIGLKTDRSDLRAVTCYVRKQDVALLKKNKINITQLVRSSLANAALVIAKKKRPVGRPRRAQTAQA